MLRRSAPPKRRRRPASQGHPSRGRPTVGGGTKSKPTTYRSPTPSRKVQRHGPTPASQGHPSRGRKTVSGGTKKNPKTKAYKSPTPSLKKQRQQRRQAAARRALIRRNRRDANMTRTGRIQKSGAGDFIKEAIGETAKRTVTTGAEVLDQSTRLGEFMTGSADYQLKRIKQGKVPTVGGAVSAGWKSGVTREKRVHGADIVKTLGIKNKAVQEGAGLAIDVGIDPATYGTGGLGAGAKGAAKVAAKAGAKAEAEALAKGASRKAAKKAKSKASRKAYKKAPKNRGLTVGALGHQTSGKTTAAIARKTGLAGRKAPKRQATSKAIPVRPEGISEKEWARLKAADRERRGIIMHETRRVSRRGRAIRKEVGVRKRRLGKKRIPPEVSNKIVDAIESGDLSKLTPAERRAAEALTREQEKLLKLRRDAGERPSRYKPRDETEPKGYVFRQGAKELDGDKPKRGQPSKRTTTMADFQRGDRRPMATVREVEPGKYVEDIETTLRVKGQKDVARAANTRFRGQVMEMGRKLKPSSRWDTETEGVYAVRDTPSGKRLVDVSKETFEKGEVVILKREVAENANAAMEATGRLPFIDPVTNAVKWVLTVPNPQYWARNAYGGTYMAWQSGIRGDRVLRNTPTAVKLNRRIRKQHHAEESLTKNVGRGGRFTKETRTVEATHTAPRTTQSREEFIDSRPAARADETPTVEGLAAELTHKHGKPGVTKETEHGDVGSFLWDFDRAREAQGLTPTTFSYVHRNEAGEPVGVLKVLVGENGKPELMEIAVDPALQGQGIGKGLIARAAKDFAPEELEGAFRAGGLTEAGAGISHSVLKANPRTTTSSATHTVTKRAPGGSGMRVKVLPNGGTMDIDEFIDELERVNISGGGQTTELLGAEFRRRGKAQGAEDFPRLLAYIHWRRQGHSPEESARLTLNSQFDYGDATKFERQWAKRIIPFWTFRSRNVVHQGRTVLQRPGKFATTEKIRDTLARSAGLPEGWQDALQEGEKAQVPIPTPFEVEVPGLGKQALLLFPGLPVTDLNLYTINPNALKSQVGSSIHPLGKAIIEFSTNYNFFWRDNIETEGNRWTAAPDEIIENLPGPARKALVDMGIIRMGKDRWTGKWSWQWRGKADYLAKLTPATSVGFAQLTSSLSRKGQTAQMRSLGWLTGIRPMPFNPVQGAYDRLLKEIKNLETRKSDMEELGTHKKPGWSRKQNSGESGWNTKEYERVNTRLSRMYEMKYKLEGQLGKKDRAVPQGVGSKPKKSNWVDEMAGPGAASSGGSWVDEYAK